MTKIRRGTGAQVQVPDKVTGAWAFLFEEQELLEAAEQLRRDLEDAFAFTDSEFVALLRYAGLKKAEWDAEHPDERKGGWRAHWNKESFRRTGKLLWLIRRDSSPSGSVTASLFEELVAEAGFADPRGANPVFRTYVDRLADGSVTLRPLAYDAADHWAGYWQPQEAS